MTYTDLTKVPDHPSALLRQCGEDFLARVGHEDALIHEMYASSARALEKHETEHGVTFAALDNDALQAVREAYEGLRNLEDLSETETAIQDLLTAVDGLLGLEA